MVTSGEPSPGATSASTIILDEDTELLWQTVFGPRLPDARVPRILGVFAHPDDEVFCAGGTLARCADSGAITAVASLTAGEAGQIRDAATATRRTLGAIRGRELEASAARLGVDHVACLDLGDGKLADQPIAELAAVIGTLIEDFAPDSVVTFGPDGGSGHPDHIASCLATHLAVRTAKQPPRLLHATFPRRGRLIVEMIVEWLVSQPRRTGSSPSAAHALRLFADCTSMLGVAEDHVRVEWFPPGSYIIEQDEPSTELFCLLSGTADVVVEREDGEMDHRDAVEVGGFVGEDGLFSGRRRNAHVIARDAVTCLVLSPHAPEPTAARGEGAASPDHGSSTTSSAPTPVTMPLSREIGFTVDVRSALDRKVLALAAHRSQYALDPELLPMAMLEQILGMEHFVVAAD